jgi:hypothetical protein
MEGLIRLEESFEKSRESVLGRDAKLLDHKVANFVDHEYPLDRVLEAIDFEDGDTKLELEDNR